MTLKSKFSIFVIAASAMSAGIWLSSIQQEKMTEARKVNSLIQGNILKPARKINVPALIKDNGETFTQDDITGHWSLLFFGYTHCPDICPLTMSIVARAKKAADEEHHLFPDVFFISVDPDRDKPEMLGKYIRYFDKDFTGVTGKQDLIKALTLQMSVVFMKIPAAGQADEISENDYLVDHSSALLLLNPEGKLTAFLNAPHDPGTILKDIQKVISSQ